MGVLCISQSCTVYVSKDWDHTFHFKEQLFAVFIDVPSLFIEPSARYGIKILTTICYELQVLFLQSHPKQSYSCLKAEEWGGPTFMENKKE